LNGADAAGAFEKPDGHRLKPLFNFADVASVCWRFASWAFGCACMGG
jgi:hypothetical protein